MTAIPEPPRAVERALIRHPDHGEISLHRARRHWIGIPGQGAALIARSWAEWMAALEPAGVGPDDIELVVPLDHASTVRADAKALAGQQSQPLADALMQLSGEVIGFVEASGGWESVDSPELRAAHVRAFEALGRWSSADTEEATTDAAE